MSRPEVLVAMNADRALLDDAGADTVRAFDVLRPHSSQPPSPVLELVRHRLIAAMVESDSLCVAQQDDVPQLPHDRIETINLLLCQHGNRVEGIATVCKFPLGEDVRRRADIRIEMMFGGASAPR